MSRVQPWTPVSRLSALQTREPAPSARILPSQGRAPAPAPPESSPVRTILQQCLLPEVTFIQIFDVFYGWGCLGPRPTESKRKRFRSRNSGVGINLFWLNGIGIGIDSTLAMLCWNRNRNQLQFFRAGIGIDSGQLESSTSLDRITYLVFGCVFVSFKIRVFKINEGEKENNKVVVGTIICIYTLTIFESINNVLNFTLSNTF